NDELNITGIIDWSGAQTIPCECLAASPEFITFPGLSEQQNEPIIAFRTKVAEALKERELRAHSSNLELRPPHKLSSLIGSRTAEIVYRCTYTYPWRALSDARLISRLLYGSRTTWDDLKRFHNDTVKGQ